MGETNLGAPLGMHNEIVCRSCGEEISSGGMPSSVIGAYHLMVCPRRDPFLFVPAWSVGWPRYGTPKDEAQWLFEISWRASGGLVDFVGIGTGMDPKKWYPFAPEATTFIMAEAAELIASDAE